MRRASGEAKVCRKGSIVASKKKERVHPRDQAIREAIQNGQPALPPRTNCAGCEFRAVCKFLCAEIKPLVPKKGATTAEYEDIWKWRRTQYILDHDEDLTAPIWRIIVQLYFRESWGCRRVARLLNVDHVTILNEIGRMMDYCWALDRQRNRQACEADRREEEAEGRF